MATASHYTRFRILDIQGPAITGQLDQFYDYVIEIELDPGGVQRTDRAKVGLRLFLTAYWGLKVEDEHDISFDQQAKARIAQYLIDTLVVLLRTSKPEFPLRLQPTVEDMARQRSVDPAKVNMSGWVELASQQPARTRTVFISCGQSSVEERELGQKIAARVSQFTPFIGYFAQNQQSLDGLTRDIFNAIHNSAGFIAVMHRRDRLPNGQGEFRGSVWVEQEIAIAAFIVQSLGLRLPSRAYVQRGIRREGVRGYILLNPIEFEASEEVFSDLETFWPQLGAGARSGDSGAA